MYIYCLVFQAGAMKIHWWSESHCRDFEINAASQLFSVIVFFFFQDSSLIKIKILSWNLGPWELFISLHSYKGILLFPAFLLKESECKSLSRVQLFETLRTVVCRLPCPWNFPGQNTGVDSRCLLQGIFLTQELKSPALQADSLPAVILNCLLSTEGCTKTASSP